MDLPASLWARSRESFWASSSVWRRAIAVSLSLSSLCKLSNKVLVTFGLLLMWSILFRASWYFLPVSSKFRWKTLSRSSVSMSSDLFCKYNLSTSALDSFKLSRSRTACMYISYRGPPCGDLLGEDLLACWQESSWYWFFDSVSCCCIRSKRLCFMCSSERSPIILMSRMPPDSARDSSETLFSEIASRDCKFSLWITCNRSCDSSKAKWCSHSA